MQTYQMVISPRFRFTVLNYELMTKSNAQYKILKHCEDDVKKCWKFILVLQVNVERVRMQILDSLSNKQRMERFYL